jgi:putative membrane protein
MSRQSRLAIALALLLVLLALSAAHPYDRTTWLMEVFPIFVGVPALCLTYRRFPLTPMVYALIFVHSTVLMVGGAYTYARVPLGFRIAEVLGLHRNPYDKIGHFIQGFVPALIAREILIRGGYVQGRKMLAFLVLCVALAVSATYELIEWGAAMAMGQGAEDFLGTQGDPWDTQSDMLWALIGAAAALLLLARMHDRQIRSLQQIDARARGAPQR